VPHRGKKLPSSSAGPESIARRGPHGRIQAETWGGPAASRERAAGYRKGSSFLPPCTVRCRQREPPRAGCSGRRHLLARHFGSPGETVAFTPCSRQSSAKHWRKT